MTADDFGRSAEDIDVRKVVGGHRLACGPILNGFPKDELRLRAGIAAAIRVPKTDLDFFTRPTALFA